ncbi:MAG: PTS sugar transporter subunit IIA [Lentisphaeria bacterium]|nr:PTS sugar transporter subunit IIA [Lentisphaeria bacterium]
MATNETNAANTVQSLTSLMSVSRIFYFRGKQKKDDVLKALIKAIASEEKFGTEDDLEWGIMHREELMSTGIGKNIATPHTSVNGLESSCIALAICPEGIQDYQSPDALPVKLVFMIVTPKENAAPQLKILAAIGNLFYDGRLKAACLASGDPERCFTIIQRAE